MEWFELVLAYLDVLAWPVVVVAVLFVFRGRVSELLGRLTEGEALGFKAKFDQQAREVREHVSDPVGITDKVTPELTAGSSSPVRVERLTINLTGVEDFDAVLQAFDAAHEVEIRIKSAEDKTITLLWSWLLGFRDGARIHMEPSDDGRRFILRHSAEDLDQHSNDEPQQDQDEN